MKTDENINPVAEQAYLMSRLLSGLPRNDELWVGIPELTLGDDCMVTQFTLSGSQAIFTSPRSGRRYRVTLEALEDEPREAARAEVVQMKPTKMGRAQAIRRKPRDGA